MGRNESFQPGIESRQGRMARNGEELKLTAFATGPWRVFRRKLGRRSDSATFRNQLKSAKDRFYQLTRFEKRVFRQFGGELV